MATPTNPMKKSRPGRSSSQVKQSQGKARTERKLITFLRCLGCWAGPVISGGPPMEDTTSMVDRTSSYKSSSASFVPAKSAADPRRKPQYHESRVYKARAYITTTDDKSQISEMTEASDFVLTRRTPGNSMFQDKLGNSLGSQRSLLWSQYAPLAKDAPPSPSVLKKTLKPTRRMQDYSEIESVSTCHTPGSSVVGLSMYDDRIPRIVRGQQDIDRQYEELSTASASCASSSQGERETCIYARSPPATRRPRLAAALLAKQQPLSPSTFQELERSFQTSNGSWVERLHPCIEAKEDCDRADSVFVPVY